MRAPLRLWHPLPWLLAVLLVGLVLTGLAAVRQQQANEGFVRERFLAASRTLSDDILRRFELYEYGLRGTRGVLQQAGEQGITAAALERYMASRDLDHEFPGARGFGYIHRLSPAGLAQGQPGRDADGQARTPVGEPSPGPGDRFVIEGIEPVDNNHQALGLDIASDPVRRYAAVTAMQRNRAIMSAPVTLPQAREAPSQGFLLLLPVYREGMPTGTVAEREAAAFGWAFAPLVTQEVLADVALPEHRLSVTLTDVTDASAPVRFFSTVAPGEAADADPLVVNLTRTVYGRVWVVSTQARPAFVAQFSLLQPRMVAVAGVLLTLLAALLQWSWLALRHRRAQALELQSRLATVVENASDAIVGQNLDGIVMLWNGAAERLFGWSREEALGRPASDLLLPRERHDEDRQLLQSVLQGGAVPGADTTLQRRDRTPVAVAITASAITDHVGRIVGVARVIRDESERKAQQQQLVALNAGLEQRVRDRTRSLEEVERFLRTVLDAVPSMISYWDGKLINRTANRAALAWRRPHGGTLVGQSLRETLGEALYLELQPQIRAALAGQPQSFEFGSRSPADGEPRELRALILPDLSEGEVLGCYAIIDEVTELNRSRRALEAALCQQATERARLDSILQGTNAGTWEWNVQTGELRVNERWSAMLGREHDGLRPQSVQTWLALTHADDLQVANGLLQQHFEGERDFYECEVRMRHADGHWVWLLDRGQLRTRTANGQPEWMYGTSQDIGARKAAEERLRASESFLEHVSEIAGVGGWQYDIGRGRFQWSRQTLRISEAVPGSIVDVHGALQFYAPEARAELLALFNRAIAGGEPFDHEAPYTTAQGRALWVRTVGTAVRDPANPLGPPVRLVGAVQDITERHAAEQALREAKRAAEAASQSKSAFLANMSHEIRTPLHAMLGVAHLLADTALDEDQRGLLGKAQAAGRALQGIVNDVLDLAKIEAGEMHLVREPLALRNLLREVESLYAIPARHKGLRLSLEWPPGLPEAVFGDAPRLRQVLANLVGNAIKFTAHGEVAIHAGVQPSGLGERLCLSVRDSGIGIPPDVQARLFRPFTQADETTTRRFGGTGLGLSIVKRLTAMMGGDVSLSSTPGEGSVFTVCLPLQRAALADVPVAAAPPPGAPGLAGLRVLVVDDSEINREIATRMLQREGAQVRDCADGAQALALLQEGTLNYDAVLMDVQMPVMDGLEATRRIRADEALRALPVVALTAGALADERQRAWDAGFSDFLPKPLEPSALSLTLRRLVPASARRATDGGALPAPAPQPTQQQPVAPARWPDIDGIDGTAAAARLGHDLSLFHKLLARLLDECGEWQVLNAGAVAGWGDALRTNWRMRAHRLKGSAGMLGAQGLATAASRLETALQQTPGRGDGVAAALVQVQQRFDWLRVAAGEVLAVPPAEPADSAQVPLDPEVQREAEARLAVQLAGQDLEALETFSACRAGLLQRLGAQRLQALAAALDGLDFAAALGELDAPVMSG